MIRTGSTAPGDYRLEVRKAIRLCDDCGAAIHVGQMSKIGGNRVVHERCVHPSERGRA